jgi:hypothetical protein
LDKGSKDQKRLASAATTFSVHDFFLALAAISGRSYVLRTQLGAAFGHVRLTGVAYESHQQTILALAGNDRRAAESSLDEAAAIVQVKLGFHVLAAVAAQALLFEDGPYLLFE